VIPIERFARMKCKRARPRACGSDQNAWSRLRLLAGTAASEIAEAALVFPIFFMLLLGIYWFGRAFNTYATINHAARQAARAAVAQSCATCGNASLTPDQIADQVKQALQASSLDPLQVINPGGTRPACGGGTASCATIVGAGEPNVCVRFNVKLPNSSPANSGAPACGVSVEYQYPYQFSLPFTSLNMQRILLNTGVQMAGEY